MDVISAYGVKDAWRENVVFCELRDFISVYESSF